MRPYSLTIRGRLIQFSRPTVMAIVNVTPDSFYADSRTYGSDEALERRVEEIMREGADFIDVGGFSTRPGAKNVTPEEELERLFKGLRVVRRIAGKDIPVSVDTFRAETARIAVSEMGADIVNDISGGLLDSEMIGVVTELKVPYILTHFRKNESQPSFQAVMAKIYDELGVQLQKCALAGLTDVIIDPGFGFGKTLEGNWDVMRQLQVFETLHRPILVGISRKSMLTKKLNIPASEALNGTTALHMIALQKGASILRVHDVKACREAIEIYCIINNLKS